MLLDIGMPGTDGFRVARGLRETPGLEDMVVIGLSGYTGEDFRVRARAAGFDHCLIKPEDPIHLKALLAQSVQVSAARREGRIEPPRPAALMAL